MASTDFEWAAYHNESDCGTQQTYRRQPQALISRLPTEAICDIFALVALKPPIQIRDPSDLHGIISVSHVCKFWRDIAINTPTLWTQIDNLNPRVTDVFIQRSKDALLELGIWLVGPFQPTINKFIPLISRATVLDVRGRRGDVVGLRTVEMILRNCPAAPRLRSFCLVGADLDHIPLPSTAFRGCTPMLRNAQIHGFTIPFSSSIYRGLKRLEVDLIAGAPQVTMLELLNILSGCPDLESVELCNAGPILEEHDGVLPLDSVNLPHLQSVSITNAASQACHQLFNHIDTPSLNDLALMCSDFVSDMATLLPKKTRLSIRSRLSTPDIVRVTCVGPEIHFQTYEVRTHSRSNDLPCAHSSFTHAVPFASLPCDGNVSVTAASPHASIAQVLHFPAARTVVIDDSHFTTSAEGGATRLAVLLQLFPAVETLKYIGSSMYGKRTPPHIVDALLNVTANDRITAFPRLQHLHLREIALDKDDTQSTTSPARAPLLGQVLRRRPFQSITLEACSLSMTGKVCDAGGLDGFIAEARKHVKDLRVEGKSNPLRLPYMICARMD